MSAKILHRKPLKTVINKAKFIAHFKQHSTIVWKITIKTFTLLTDQNIRVEPLGKVTYISMIDPNKETCVPVTFEDLMKKNTF